MPQWSLDGTSIGCMARAAGNPWRASIIPSKGGNLTPLLDGDQAEADPTWSPSGDRIAFGSAPNPNTGADAYIRILELQTKKVPTVPGSRGMNTPSWSLNGRYLAAVRSSTLELAFHEFATGKWRHLPGTRAGYLNWPADSDRLFFLSLIPGDQPRVMAVVVGTMRLFPIAGLSEIRQPSFSFGDWIGLGLHDTPLALRDLGTA